MTEKSGFLSILGETSVEKLSLIGVITTIVLYALLLTGPLIVKLNSWFVHLDPITLNYHKRRWIGFLLGILAASPSIVFFFAAISQIDQNELWTLIWRLVRTAIYIQIPIWCTMIRPVGASPMDLFDLLCLVFIILPVVLHDTVFDEHLLFDYMIQSSPYNVMEEFSSAYLTSSILVIMIYGIFRPLPDSGLHESFSKPTRRLVVVFFLSAFLLLLLIPIGLASGIISLGQDAYTPLELVISFLTTYIFTAIPIEVLFRGSIQNLFHALFEHRYDVALFTKPMSKSGLRKFADTVQKVDPELLNFESFSRTHSGIPISMSYGTKDIINSTTFHSVSEQGHDMYGYGSAPGSVGIPSSRSTSSLVSSSTYNGGRPSSRLPGSSLFSLNSPSLSTVSSSSSSPSSSCPPSPNQMQRQKQGFFTSTTSSNGNGKAIKSNLSGNDSTFVSHRPASHFEAIEEENEQEHERDRDRDHHSDDQFVPTSSSAPQHSYIMMQEQSKRRGSSSSGNMMKPTLPMDIHPNNRDIDEVKETKEGVRYGNEHTTSVSLSQLKLNGNENENDNDGGRIGSNVTSSTSALSPAFSPNVKRLQQKKSSRLLKKPFSRSSSLKNYSESLLSEPDDTSMSFFTPNPYQTSILHELGTETDHFSDQYDVFSPPSSGSGSEAENDSMADTFEEFAPDTGAGQGVDGHVIDMFSTVDLSSIPKSQFEQPNTDTNMTSSNMLTETGTGSGTGTGTGTNTISQDERPSIPTTTRRPSLLSFSVLAPEERTRRPSYAFIGDLPPNMQHSASLGAGAGAGVGRSSSHSMSISRSLAGTGNGNGTRDSGSTTTHPDSRTYLHYQTDNDDVGNNISGYDNDTDTHTHSITDGSGSGAAVGSSSSRYGGYFNGSTTNQDAYASVCHDVQELQTIVDFAIEDANENPTSSTPALVFTNSVMRRHSIPHSRPSFSQTRSQSQPLVSPADSANDKTMTPITTKTNPIQLKQERKIGVAYTPTSTSTPTPTSSMPKSSSMSVSKSSVSRSYSRANSSHTDAPDGGLFDATFTVGRGVVSDNTVRRALSSRLNIGLPLYMDEVTSWSTWFQRNSDFYYARDIMLQEAKDRQTAFQNSSGLSTPVTTQSPPPHSFALDMYEGSHPGQDVDLYGHRIHPDTNRNMAPSSLNPNPIHLNADGSPKRFQSVRNVINRLFGKGSTDSQLSQTLSKSKSKRASGFGKTMSSDKEREKGRGNASGSKPQQMSYEVGLLGDTDSDHSEINLGLGQGDVHTPVNDTTMSSSQAIELKSTGKAYVPPAPTPHSQTQVQVHGAGSINSLQSSLPVSHSNLSVMSTDSNDSMVSHPNYGGSPSMNSTFSTLSPTLKRYQVPKATLHHLTWRVWLYRVGRCLLLPTWADYFALLVTCCVYVAVTVYHLVRAFTPKDKNPSDMTASLWVGAALCLFFQAFVCGLCWRITGRTLLVALLSAGFLFTGSHFIQPNNLPT